MKEGFDIGTYCGCGYCTFAKATLVDAYVRQLAKPAFFQFESQCHELFRVVLTSLEYTQGVSTGNDFMGADLMGNR